jgi:hypothetical protein
LFHNATFFGSCIIHILHTGCANIQKKIRRQRVNSGLPLLLSSFPPGLAQRAFLEESFSFILITCPAEVSNRTKYLQQDIQYITLYLQQYIQYITLYLFQILTHPWEQKKVAKIEVGQVGLAMAGGQRNHHFVYSQNGGVLLTLQRFKENGWGPLTAFPVKILANVSSIGSGSVTAVSSHRGQQFEAD